MRGTNWFDLWSNSLFYLAPTIFGVTRRLIENFLWWRMLHFLGLGKLEMKFFRIRSCQLLGWLEFSVLVLIFRCHEWRYLLHCVPVIVHMPPSEERDWIIWRGTQWHFERREEVKLLRYRAANLRACPRSTWRGIISQAQDVVFFLTGQERRFRCRLERCLKNIIWICISALFSDFFTRFFVTDR